MYLYYLYLMYPLHSGKATLVTWTFNFPDDLWFNLPLTKHQLAVIGKKYVWDCQIFDIWMIEASIVDVMWCYCSNTSVKLYCLKSYCAMHWHTSLSAVQCLYSLRYCQINCLWLSITKLTMKYNIYSDKRSKLSSTILLQY